MCKFKFYLTHCMTRNLHNGWPDSIGSAKALIPHCRIRICYQWSHSFEVWVYKPSKKTIKRWHCSGNEKNKLKPQSTVNNQNTEDDFKILLRIISILSPLLSSYIYVIRQSMSGRHLTHSEYALQKVVESFGDLLFQLEEAHVTHTYRVVFPVCQLENIDYLVLRYLNTGGLPL
jgi:hypothetical protein